MKKLTLFAATLILLAACTAQEPQYPARDYEPNAYEEAQNADDTAESNETAYPPEPPTPDYPIVVNGVGLEDNFYTLEGETTPIYVPLTPILNVLGIDWVHNHVQPMVFTIGFDYTSIDITDRSAMILKNGEDIEMTHEALMRYNVFYVPITFFSDILELETARFTDGGYFYLAE